MISCPCAADADCVMPSASTAPTPTAPRVRAMDGMSFSPAQVGAAARLPAGITLCICPTPYGNDREGSDALRSFDLTLRFHGAGCPTRDQDAEGASDQRERGLLRPLFPPPPE